MHHSTPPPNDPILIILLSYIDRGWPVFPIIAKSKKPLTKNGVHDATTNEQKVRQWFKEHPGCNWGIATGSISGFFAVDIDTDKGGEESLVELERKKGALPKTVTSLTGGGGQHRLFRCKVKIKNRVGIAPGIDIRGDGGYIVVEPSIHPNGRPYAWEVDHHPDEIQPSDPPMWLLDLIEKPDRNTFYHEIGSKIEKGKRNDTLFRLGCSMRAKGFHLDAIAKALLAENKLSCIPPLPDDEVKGIAESCCRYNITNTISQSNWPKSPASEAYYGLAGEFVHLMEPHSEADPFALLIQFLIAAGNIVGRSGYFLVEDDRHYTNMYAVLVGSTSKGRKGTSWGRVKNLFAALDPVWKSDRIVSGLSSGEGLINSVRNKDEENGASSNQDKRAFVIESEFSKTLQVIRREGNTLSAVVRDAWDTGDLGTLTKHDPLRASGAHISLVCHITEWELRRAMPETEKANGFGNRFLWACVKRSKMLPEGGNITENDLKPILEKLKASVNFSRSLGRLSFNEEGRCLWKHVLYPHLGEEVPGLCGAMISRAEAQVLRLATIFSILDCSGFLTAAHLNAAMAVWEYCENSCKHLFGDAIGDGKADQLLAELRRRPEGMTRTEIRDFFSRNLNHQELEHILSHLLHHNLVFVIPNKATGGAPAEKWFAT